MATATSCLPRTTVAGGASVAVASDEASIDLGETSEQPQTCIHERSCVHLFARLFCLTFVIGFWHVRLKHFLGWTWACPCLCT